VPSPLLVRCTRGTIAWHSDPALLERHGILVTFSERTGGVSREPYSSLNLAGHVEDDADAVDENRRLLLDGLGVGALDGRLTCAEQVHGQRIAVVGETEAGAGARAGAGCPSIPRSDTLLTSLPDTPLLLCYADCVPVVLVATAPRRAVAVVHAGWRGALQRLPGSAASALAETAGCATGDLLAYIGPHVCEGCYQVGDDVRCRFENEFGTMRSAQGRLDLGAVVSRTLRDAGVPDDRQADLGRCTAEETERFFSYRAEGVTGRHGALAVILEGQG
jgi:polyphenol oxidase